MNNKICKACGQSNFQEATVCSNCRLNLPAAANNPNVKTQVKPEKSNKMYWIIGGVGAVVIIGGFLIAVLAVGLYYYSGSSNNIVETTTDESNSNVESKTLADKKDKPEKSKNDGGNLEKLLEKTHSKIGIYKMQSVSTIDDRKKMVFPTSSDEAFALYSSNDKNPLEILFSIAKFSTISDAKKDVAAIKGKIRSEEGKILKESKLSDGVIITYRKKKLIGILDCKDTTCIQTTGIDGKKVSSFYKNAQSGIF